MKDPKDPTGLGFGQTLIHWQKQYGRRELPWQGRGPYEVWLSEIMLQQTQVATVLNYYPRFLQRFPDLHTLAQAELADVLSLWSGLGYYSRARHLHRCAQVLVQAHQSQFPTTAKQLSDLPGIGPSTAAAIAAFCFKERVSILDGNVQRVLARYRAHEADVSSTAGRKAMQALAQDFLPAAAADMPSYTQALMDLGALVCTPRKPQCPRCPLQADCRSHAQGQVLNYPIKSKKINRKQQSLYLLVLLDASGRLHLQARAEKGIWPGLYAPPVFASEQELKAALPPGAAWVQKPSLRHDLTHRELQLHPVLCFVKQHPQHGFAGPWLRTEEALKLGLPQPIRALLEDRWPGFLWSEIEGQDLGPRL